MRSHLLLSCALTALLALGCSADGEPPEEPPSETPEPEAEEPEAEEPPPPDDVEGVVEKVTVDDLSVTGSGLYPDGSEAEAAVPIDGVAIDGDAVDAAVAAATAWVDAHLTDVQAGGAGLVAAAGPTGDPAPVSEGLTDPDHPVTGAAYVVTVGARGVPEWVRLSAEVTREDGAASANFVFLPDDDGVSLLAVHVGEGTPVAAP